MWGLSDRRSGRSWLARGFFWLLAVGVAAAACAGWQHAQPGRTSQASGAVAAAGATALSADRIAALLARPEPEKLFLTMTRQVTLVNQPAVVAPRAPMNSHPVVVVPSGSTRPASAIQAECRYLDARIAELDALARRPHTGQMQDWIRSQRQQARDRQFELRCG